MTSSQRIGNGKLIFWVCLGSFFLMLVVGNFLVEVVMPETVAHMAVRQLDQGGGSKSVRTTEQLKNILLGIEGSIVILAGLMLLVPPAWKKLLSFTALDSHDNLSHQQAYPGEKSHR